jgi:hypothetical protein
MLTIIENKRRTGAAAISTVLLLLLGFGVGRLSNPAPASSAPRLAALTAQTARGEMGADTHSAAVQAVRLHAAQRNAAQLHAANARVAGQLAAARACASKHHRVRACLRRALR